MRKLAMFAAGATLALSGELASCSIDTGEPELLAPDIIELEIRQGQVVRLDDTFEPVASDVSVQTIQVPVCARYINPLGRLGMDCRRVTIDADDTPTVTVTLRGCQRKDGELTFASADYIGQNQRYPADYPFFGGTDYRKSGANIIKTDCEVTLEIDQDYGDLLQLGDIEEVEELKFFDARLPADVSDSE